MRPPTFLAVAGALAISACSNGDTTPVSQNRQEAESWSAWHDEKQQLDKVVLEAINEPGGGDYAKAADATRNSSRPPAVKQFELGELIVYGILRDSKRLPPETLEQGVRMIEDSAVAPGHEKGVAAQALRMLFERGDRTPPKTFPIDRQVAACWLDVEEKRSNDAARCIALRRQRLPNIGG